VAVVRQALLRALPSRVVAKAAMLLPAVPGLVDHYVQGLCLIWATLGHPLDSGAREHLRRGLDSKLKEAFAHSPYSRVTVVFGTEPPPKTGLTWSLSITEASIVDEYDEWVKTREPPLFGKLPDCKVMDLAKTLGTPAEVGVLDIGAGTGRNSLPLAREGFRVDAIEFAPALVKALREEIAGERLHVGVFELNILDSAVELPDDSYSMILLSEVVFHFRTGEHLRTVFELANRLLKPGGYLLFNAFLPLDGFKPDDVAKQVSEVMWCRITTRHELQEATLGLQLDFLSEESTLDYEREHYPAGQWPPTSWYEAWCSGQNAFKLPADKSPIELRWLVYRKNENQPT
jgi:SAM-dependent methyltransferase